MNRNNKYEYLHLKILLIRYILILLEYIQNENQNNSSLRI